QTHERGIPFLHNHTLRRTFTDFASIHNGYRRSTSGSVVPKFTCAEHSLPVLFPINDYLVIGPHGAELQYREIEVLTGIIHPLRLYDLRKLVIPSVASADVALPP